MNISAFHALQSAAHEALGQERLLDALIKLDELCMYASKPAAVEAVRKLKQDYAMLLGYMKRGMTDVDRERYFREFLRKANSIYGRVCRSVELEHGDGTEAQLWQRLHQSPERLAEIYVPFVEGDGDSPASIADILSDPLASYQQMFDTIWTSGQWSVADRELIYKYVMNDSAPRINRLTIVSATGLALLFSFDEQKFLLLLSVIEEYQVEVSIRALVMSLLAYAVYGDDLIQLYPSIQLKFGFLRELTYFHPLVMAVQKALLVAKLSPELAGEFDKKLPEHMEKAHDSMKELPKDASGEEIQQCIEDNPQLRKFRNEMLDMMHDYVHMQEKGVDLNYHSFFHMREVLPFFSEAANWFCPFSFEHPLLFNINAATRFLSVIVNNKSCDTDRYGMVFAMAPHLPEIHIIKQDAVTMEETKIEGDDIESFMEQLSEEMEHKSTDADKSLLTLDPARLYRHVVSCVQDCFRFFSIFKPEGQTQNAFAGDLRLWRLEYIWPIFKGNDAMRELADWLFELEMFDDAVRFYDKFEHDADLCQRMGYAYEKLDAPKLAQTLYREALAMDPEDEWTKHQLLASYRNNGEIALACELLESILAAAPDSQRYTRQLAELYVRLEEYDSALKLYSKLDYLRSGHLPTLRALAWCHMALGHYDKAGQLYLDIIGHDDVVDEDYLNAGHCALLQNDVPTAVIYYQECLKMRGEEYASSELFAADELFLMERGVDSLTHHLIIDLINI